VQQPQSGVGVVGTVPGGARHGGMVSGGLYSCYWRVFQLVVLRLVKRKQQGGCLS
jgi:hypothetical protein